MLQTEEYTGPERRSHDRSQGPLLRRRRNEPVEVERRRGVDGTPQIAAALELHLDECKTRRSMIDLLERWLVEARAGDESTQDAGYTRAVEHSLEVMRSSPDRETAIAVLQRR